MALTQGGRMSCLLTIVEPGGAGGRLGPFPNLWPDRPGAPRRDARLLRQPRNEQAGRRARVRLVFTCFPPLPGTSSHREKPVQHPRFRQSVRIESASAEKQDVYFVPGKTQRSACVLAGENSGFAQTGPKPAAAGSVNTA